MVAPLVHGRLDLGPPLGEPVQQPPVDTVDLGVPVVHLSPPHPQPYRQLRPQDRLVHEPGSAGMAVQDRGVQRPETPVDPFHHVRRQTMSVQMGVAARLVRCPNAATTNPSPVTISTPPSHRRRDTVAWRYR